MNIFKNSKSLSFKGSIAKYHVILLTQSWKPRRIHARRALQPMAQHLSIYFYNECR